ncbi:MAG TPA: pectinesterase family protein [Capsulimonadaceae bacterium]|nr:pectinesterase family protein [Capsulimonadaceae bacterium]
MRPALRLFSHLFRIVVCVALVCALCRTAQAADATLFPANNAVRINPDTHLVLIFPSAPTLGKSGQIRIYDAAGHQLVDTLDLSIPPGPDPSRRVTITNGVPLDASVPTSPTTTTPAVRVTPPDLHNYQLTTIGGLDNFHFYPVIIHGNMATIYPHNHALQYGHTYIVQIDPAVFTLAGAGDPFAGFTTDSAWTFTTKKSPPRAGATRITVDDDGKGDFNTIQGAVDFVPDHPLHRVTIFIKNGTYEEIVFCRGKSNLTFKGQDRDKVQVGYANNSAFNPPQPGPNRRCAFSVYECSDIDLANFSVNNYAYGQAEGLLLYGQRIIVDHMNIKGSGDALNLRGPVYLADSRIIGDGDTILGVGPAFFHHCELQSFGAFMWIRNTEANHGNVFVDCSFTARVRAVSTARSPAAAGPTAATSATPAPAQPVSGAVFARLPNNHGANYPYAEAVLINCRLQGIPPVGWGPIEADTAHLHLWEFHSTDLDGHPIDVTQRNPASKQLTLPQDAQTIANYSDPSFVLGGWKPNVKD